MRNWDLNIHFNSGLGSVALHAAIAVTLLISTGRVPVKEPRSIIYIRAAVASSAVAGKAAAPAMAGYKTRGTGQVNNASNSVQPDNEASAGEVNFTVNYPRLSRLLGEEGDVIFLIVYDTDLDKPTFSRIQSSGFTRLDAAAEKALREHLDIKGFARNLKRVRFVFRLNG